MSYSYGTTKTIWTKCFRPLIWDLGCISLKWWVNRGLGWTLFHTSKTIFIILMFIISGKPVGTWTIYFIYIYFYIRFKFESVDDNQGVKSGRCFRMWSSARYYTLMDASSYIQRKYWWMSHHPIQHKSPEGWIIIHPTYKTPWDIEIKGVFIVNHPKFLITNLCFIYRGVGRGLSPL